MKKLNVVTIMLGLFEYRLALYLCTFATGLCFVVFQNAVWSETLVLPFSAQI